MSEWQPIETAPKSKVINGAVRAKYLLGFIPDEAAYVDRAAGISVIWWEPILNGGCWNSENCEDAKPSHWHPLPEPPEDGS